MSRKRLVRRRRTTWDDAEGAGCMEVMRVVLDACLYNEMR